MTDAPIHSNAPPSAVGWSSRILIASVAGILFVTLYPFRFAFSHHLAIDSFPFLLGSGGKTPRLFDAFLNVLLFVPYGFGVAGKLHGQRRSWLTTLGLTLAAGAAFSYAIELLQIYIPFRDSGWEDIFTNSTGAVVGFLLFDWSGQTVFRFLSACDKFLAAFLTVPRAVLVLSVYMGVWFAISVPLQKQTRLSNWSSDALLVVGNGASSRSTSAWKGEILRLEIWDRAVSSGFAPGLTSGGRIPAVDPISLAAYEFSSSSPLQDRRRLLPDLVWTPKAPVLAASEAVELDGKSWLVSRSPVSALVNDIQKTRQFSLRVLCKPAKVEGIDGRIVSISQAAGSVNFEIRQQDSNLVFWFRSPLSAKRSGLSWAISDVFAIQQPRDILLSYDGSNLSLYIDGKEERRAYPLGPGASLAQLVRRIKPGELEGYRYIFYAIVFLPLGFLLGFTWRNLVAQPVFRSLWMVLGLLLPAVFLEIILVRVSGRPISIGSIVLAALLTLGGGLWVNRGLGAVNASSTRDTHGPAR